MSRVIANCLGCNKPITKRTNAMLVRQPHDDGTITEYAICAACMGRAMADPTFDTRLNWRAAQLPKKVAA